jgi:Bacterial TSP3 repeat
MASIPLLPKGVLPCDRRGELRLCEARLWRGPGRKTGLTGWLFPLFLVATLPNLMAQSRPMRESVLFSVYRQYLLAIEAHDLDKLEALSVDQTGRQQLAKLKEVKDEKQQGALFDLLDKAQPESAEMVNEKIVGDRGLLAIQGYSRADLFAMKLDPSQVPKGFRLASNKPIKKRQYELVLFKRIGGEWKIYRIKSFTYKDPRPLLEPVDGRREQKYLTVQFHCDFSQENVVPGDKAFQWMNENSHWSCFAGLRRNASLCDRIGSLIPAQQKAFFADNTQMQQTQCKLDVIERIGDPKICESIKNSNLLPNAHEQCLEKIADYDLIPGFNIYALDSDGDGLTDLEEIEFFNTSANKPDTDGDGKTDFEEVEAMTNPLGTGRLGDHLK